MIENELEIYFGLKIFIFPQYLNLRFSKECKFIVWWIFVDNSYWFKYEKFHFKISFESVIKLWRNYGEWNRCEQKRINNTFIFYKYN